MFDTIGTHNDDEATQRSFLALLLTSCLVGGGAAFTLGFLAYRVVEVTHPRPVGPAAPIADHEFAKLDLFDDAGPAESAPPLPAPPRSPEVEKQRSPIDPDELAPEQKPLDSEPLVLRPPPAGTADGIDDGHEGGTIDGSPAGRSGGTGDGDGLAGTGTGRGAGWVHSSEIEPRRRPQITYPEAARGLFGSDQRCVARVDLDERGIPLRVEVEACPPAFHQAAIDGLLRWRWYPPKIDGRSRAVSTKISVLFKE